MALKPPSGSRLTTIQISLRALQITSAVILLALYSYTLGALANRGLPTPTDVRAVEGIVGITLGYALASIITLKFFPIRTFPAFVAIVLDVAFAATFIYVAVANKGGAGSCSGEVSTHFGKGKAGDKPKGKDGFMALPTYGDACRLLSAGLAISILTIFLFIASIVTTVSLGRNHHREKRQSLAGQEPLSQSTSYPPPDAVGAYPTADAGEATPAPPPKFSIKNLFRRRQHVPLPDHENSLPQHTRPEQLAMRQQSVAGPGHDDYVRVNDGTHPMTQVTDAGNPYRRDSTPIYHGTNSEFDIGTATDLHDRRRRDSFQQVPLQEHSYTPTETPEIHPALRPSPSPYTDGYSPSPPSRPIHQPSAIPPFTSVHPHPVRPTPSSVGQTASSSTQLGEVDMGDQYSEIYFPEGPYENLRPASQRSGIPGRALQATRPRYQYSDGVYDV